MFHAFGISYIEVFIHTK